MSTWQDRIEAQGRHIASLTSENDTLATRLAAVERERDALRELLKRALSCVEHEAKQALAHENAVYEHRRALAADITTALLGKENTDGQ